MNRAKTVIAIAPASPPCFASRDSWLEYLATAALERDRRNRSSPLVVSKVDGVKFNLEFNYCGECSERYSAQMHKVGKCQPDHLQRIAAASEKLTEATTC